LGDTAWNLLPSKPVLDAEPNYEDHPVNPWPKWNPENGYYRDYHVRKQTYRSVFAGACGVTYGHHSVWQFWSYMMIYIPSGKTITVNTSFLKSEKLRGWWANPRTAEIIGIGLFINKNKIK
jgi:hypothetical protein